MSQLKDPRSGLDLRHDNELPKQSYRGNRSIRQNPNSTRRVVPVPQRIVSTEESPDVTTHRRRMTSFFPKKS